MSEEYPRRGRNWKTAMGVLFLVVATVTLVRDIIIWSPDFFVEFFLIRTLMHKKFLWVLSLLECL